MKKLTIALAGNPNSGKTTIFNNLTGARQKVGNWPGVTVEKKEGYIKKNGYNLKIVDLPGTYSLTPFSIEEIAVRDFILNEKPDVIVNIIDSANLERSLYLAMQIIELDCPVVFALNMADIAKARGISINKTKLSELLNLPVIFTVGNKGQGTELIINTIIKEAESFSLSPKKRKVKYNREIEYLISNLKKNIEKKSLSLVSYPKRWIAIKLLENDKDIIEKLKKIHQNKIDDLINLADKYRARINFFFKDEPEIVLTDDRYGFIAGIIKETVFVSIRKRIDISRNIDLVLTNKFLGFPIFIFFIWLMFELTFSLGSYPMEWISSGVSLISSFIDTSLSDSIIKDLILNGIIAGIGSVIVFLPNILILFFCIALFEDTGYMARVAFLMDRIMHIAGLHGKSFIPMLMGFGCSVPAIMATRMLESEKDRILTIIITPFMSCSARLPVYIMLAGIFFKDKAGTVIFGLYLTGIFIAILSSKFLKATLLKGEDAPFVMELPPYRVPMLKSLIIHMWERSKMFLKKMGGVILLGSIIIWFLFTFPQNIQFTSDYSKAINDIKIEYSQKIASSDKTNKQRLKKELKGKIQIIEETKEQERISKSYIGMLGKGIEPLLAPVGINWLSGIAIVTGLVAKEVVVSTMGILYGVEKEDLGNAISRSGMTCLSALSMMVFVLLYIPCFATIITIWKEVSINWAFFNLFYTTFVAWTMSFLVYQGGVFLGFG
ncbi:MAG: ferrous iron transport protein B [Desulfobacteraceae bacterium 4572_130]|nr:MAG: ferrous iron transport protein B [Desulfobacteraceae bacterium 4572_130]